MVITTDVGVLTTLSPHSNSFFKAHHSRFLGTGLSFSEIAPRRLSSKSDGLSMRCQSNLTFGAAGDERTPINSFSQEAETFLLNAINMNFFERLNLAWKIVFPTPKTRKSSNAKIAKQRLKMILFADRCAVSDDAKKKIVKSIVKALSDFVEIESQDNVQVNVSTDMGLGTVCSVTVPVRRVKPQYQEDDESGSIMNVEYKDKGETSGSVDVTFDFYIPSENSMT
ncbi:hypothetical protein vseg_001776 [Gypsophila vaccaria]